MVVPNPVLFYLRTVSYTYNVMNNDISTMLCSAKNGFAKINSECGASITPTTRGHNKGTSVALPAA